MKCVPSIVSGFPSTITSHCIDSAFTPENLLDSSVESNLTSISLDDLLDGLPHHAWSKLGIIKGIDQRLDYVALALLF